MAKSQMDFMKDIEGEVEGFEGIDSATKAIPFIKLAQDLTPEMKKSRPEYIPGLELGDFFNSITGEIYGSHIELIFVKFERLYIEWLPNRGGFVGYHSPKVAQDKADDLTFGKWKTQEGNDLTEYYAYHVVLVGHEGDGVMVLSLSSTAITKAKKLNRTLTTHMLYDGNNKPILNAKGEHKRARGYYLIYNVDSKLTPKGANDYYSYRFQFKSYITEEQDKIVEKERLALPDKPVDYAQIENKSAGTDHSEDDF